MILDISRLVRLWTYLFDYFLSNPLLFCLLIIPVLLLSILFFIYLYFCIKEKK